MKHYERTTLNIKMAQFGFFFLNILWYSAWFFYIKFLIYGVICSFNLEKIDIEKDREWCYSSNS